MRIPLSNPLARALFSLIVISICASLAYLDGKSLIAAAFNSTSTLQLWETAARLEPYNAAYWEKLGLYREWDMERRDLVTAARYFQRASQLDPLSAKFELELANVEETRGEISEARQAYQVANRDSPQSADVAWQYGSFLLRQGDTQAGFSEVRRALENDPSLETSALAECMRTGANTTVIVDEALPQRSEAYLAALDYFVWQKRTDAALVVWTRLLRLGQAFAMPRALPLVNELIDEDRISEAKTVWDQALLASRWPVDPMNTESLIFNGGFENNLLNGGFDWREFQQTGISYSFDNSIAHSGRRSLRITFDGSQNLNFQHFYEYVLVQPNKHYRLSAFLRTENISTDSGIRFEIVDSGNHAVLPVLTPDVIGTSPWKQVQANVNAGAETDLLEIVLSRIPSEKLDNKFKGTVWVDDVSLRVLSNEVEGRAR